jgi:PAS domain S-box-containing protein
MPKLLGKNTLAKKPVIPYSQPKSLIDSEARYRRLFETAQDGILILDAQTGQIADVNPFLIDMLGYSYLELLGKKLWEIGFFKDVAASTAAFQNLQEKGYVRYHDLPLETKDGRAVNVEFVSNSYYVDGQKVIQCNIRDITERKRAETALQESEEKYRSLVNNVKLGIFRSSPGAKGKFLEVNPAMEEITGYSRRELLTMDVSCIYADPRQRAKFINKIGRSKGVLQLEFTLKKKDNSAIVVAVIDTLIRDNTGKLIYVDGILEDITEHKKMQANAIENETLKHLNSAKSDLLANVSHELRTPLSSIKGFIESLLETDVKWTKKQQLDFLQSADVEVDRLVILINDLLVMSKIDSGKIVLDSQNYSLKEILKSSVSVLSRITIKHNLRINLAPDLPPVFVDKVRITQVITNLVENATKFSAEGSQILIKARSNEGMVLISIEDKGIGMTQDVVANLFNRFYQAQQVVSGKTKGTGLGLAICKGIVEAHGGRIWVESQANKGSKFIFTVPLAKT